MAKERSVIWEIRESPNGNQYAFISLERTKNRVAALLVHTKNIQWGNARIITVSDVAWWNWRIMIWINDAHKITEAVRLEAYHLLHDTPDPQYKK